MNQQDYGVFLSYLKEYLLPKNEKELFDRLSDPQISLREKNKVLKSLRMNNFAGEIVVEIIEKFCCKCEPVINCEGIPFFMMKFFKNSARSFFISMDEDKEFIISTQASLFAKRQ